MYNAPYHSTLLEKIPSSASTKAAFKEWFKVHKISFEETMSRNELFQIITRNKPEKRYMVDQITERYGHKVLRLPPYHCIFNPIELIWGIAKNYCNGHSNQNCLDLCNEALSKITPSVCVSSIRHVEEEINKW
ncbi:uncharacterized protein LOC143189904 [Rhynchophorus ferrugineus]|uniref:uncharacterized protein LOC143189904 n=1 Tax=Rhynchophorus ferrugineus TaxID=354439 RepID=UPI003FCD814D